MKGLGSSIVSAPGAALTPEDWEALYALAIRDPARNYFILLGLLHPETIYNHVIFQSSGDGLVEAAFFLRQSGNAQLCLSARCGEVEAFAREISGIGFKALISAERYVDMLMPYGFLDRDKPGAEIALLSESDALNLGVRVGLVTKPLTVDALDEVVELYRKCFHSFSPKALMAEKLVSGRGRGVLLYEDGRLVSCAQSEFETEEMALIVGVATAPDCRGRGLATVCVQALIDELKKPGRGFALQYENPDAGRIYKRLGFKRVDRLGHYLQRKDGWAFGKRNKG
jgi:GNAT superfamily N-acetyltransferase